jgi:hypothetical protein
MQLYGKLLKWSFILIMMYISHTSYLSIQIYMYVLYVCMYWCHSNVEKRISLTPIR